MMETERDLISFFYVGKNENNGEYLMPKIGESKQKLKDRAREIRKDGDRNFQMMGCLVLIGATKAERKYIESYVRMKMEKYGKNIKNDHFLIRAKAKKYCDAQYTAFMLVALGYAMDLCNREGFLYELKIF